MPTEKFPSVNIYIPKDIHPKLIISTASGDVSIAKALTLSDADISLSSGDLNFMADVKGTVSLNSKSGDIDINSNSISDVDISLSSGDLTFKSDVSGNMSITGGSGDIDINNSIIEGKLYTFITSGNVNLNNMDADSMDISVINGDIEALLLSGKDFSANSNSGDINIPYNSSGGICILNSNSGDIDVRVIN